MLDEIMAALADEHRRELLVALSKHNPQAAVQTPEGVQLGDEQLEELQIEMCHNHLPRLEDAGFIEWQKKQDIVVKGPEFEQIEPVLEMFEENADELPVEWP
ncbi:helix-turn-helix domain-containing protein (plasmid) [Natrinema zhouii]|uniref:helix-turn-helix domain-containing protein n=1 Tax=Natrinema zhouii TaxID=1710539 RepID=UPI001CFFFB04|nr:helix-turn-helix domain-containing protein [Natrinema zhouii]UHQ99012.1 helix-turn-helix domain-containing protein [Natrinema zhouii]